MSLFRRMLIANSGKQTETPFIVQMMPLYLDENGNYKSKYSYVGSGTYLAENGISYYSFDTTILNYVDVTSSLTDGDSIVGLYTLVNDSEVVAYSVGSGSTSKIANFNKLSSLTIPDYYNGLPIIDISDTLSYKDTSLQILKLNNVIETIKVGAISYFYGLKYLHIGESVSKFNSDSGSGFAINYVPLLQKITVDANNTTYDSRNNCNAIITTATNTLLVGCRNTKIPSSVTTIGAYAFYRASAKDIDTAQSWGDGDYILDVPENVTQLYANSFLCAGFTKINLPSTIKIIPYRCFNSSQLKEMILPEGIEIIGENSFYNCTKLTGQIVIPKSVTEIQKLAFYSTKPSSVTFNHSATDTISLPTAGSSTGVFYSKTARTFDVYTDNETIKNYDWASDNATVTLYHLDGTLWE